MLRYTDLTESNVSKMVSYKCCKSRKSDKTKVIDSAVSILFPLHSSTNKLTKKITEGESKTHEKWEHRTCI